MYLNTRTPASVKCLPLNSIIIGFICKSFYYFDANSLIFMAFSIITAKQNVPFKVGNNAFLGVNTWSIGSYCVCRPPVRRLTLSRPAGL